MQRRLRWLVAVGAAATVVSATLMPAIATSTRAASGETIRVTGTLLVSPAEETGPPSYALALADGDLVPVRGDLGSSPQQGTRMTVDLELPHGVRSSRDALAQVDQQGTTLVVRSVVDERPPAAAAEAAPAVHRVFVAAPTNLGSFPMTDAAMLAQLRQAADFWVDEADGAIVDMVVPSSIVRYHATEATDANNCGLASGVSEFFEALEEAAAQFPGVDFVDGTDHVVLLGPSLCDGGSVSGRASLGDSPADGGVQVTHMSGPSAVGTLAHEWGHNFGLMHSNIGPCDEFCDREYFNIYNVMGFGTGTTHNRLTALSTAFRRVARLHESGEIEEVSVGDGTSSITLTRRLFPRSSESGLRSLSVLDPDTGDRLYVEYRSGTLQDAGSAYAAGWNVLGYRFERGVVIEHVDDRAAALVLNGGATHLANSTWTNSSGTLSITAGTLSDAGVNVTVTYAPGDPWPTPVTAAVDGEPVVNRWVSARTSAVGAAYQWLVDGSPVPYADDFQFRLRPEDSGRQVAVAVTEHEYGRGMRTVVSDAVEVRPGTLRYYAEPSVVGTAEVGRTLRTSGAIWDDPDFDGPTATALQWRVDGTPVPGATGTSYVVRPEDAGHRITVSDTGTRDGYATLTLTSDPTAVVPLPTLPDVPTPVIEGTARVDSTLAARPGTWPSGTTLTYQWRANGTTIRDADDSTYTPTAADVGRRISVQVTGTKPGYQPATKTSAATAPVAKATLAAGDPTIAGRARVGRTLRAVTGTWTDGTTFGYRWKADGAKIRGATGPALLLKARHRGTRITVVVTGSRDGYTTISRTSPPTRPVRR